MQPEGYFTLQVYFLLHAFRYSDCVLRSEHCQNVGDLQSVLYLNASCDDTDRGLKLLLCRHCVRVWWYDKIHCETIEMSQQLKIALYSYWIITFISFVVLSHFLNGNIRSEFSMPPYILISGYKRTYIMVESAFFGADLFPCHSRKGADVTNNINIGSVLFKCPSKLWQ